MGKWQEITATGDYEFTFVAGTDTLYITPYMKLYPDTVAESMPIPHFDQTITISNVEITATQDIIHAFDEDFCNLYGREL